MEDKLVTLAILTYTKAQILKNVLENEGIETYIHNVNQIQPVVSSGVRLRIKESDLPRALKITESSTWLSESIVGEKTPKVDSKSNKILIPVDFSSYSMKACEFGFNLAKTENSEVILLHVYFTPIYASSLPYGDVFNYQIGDEESVKTIIQQVHSDLNALSDKIKEKVASGEFPDIKYSCILREGIPEEEILRYAKEQRPKVIIMGTRGKSQKDIDLIGSVTAEIIDRSRTAVLAIPENTPFKEFNEVKRIAFLTNFDQRDLIAFEAFFNTWKSFHFSVSLIHLAESKDTWNEIKLAGIKDYFQKQYPGLEIHYDVVMNDNLLKGLDQYIKDKQLPIGRKICCSLEYYGATTFSIQDGTHASLLANSVYALLAQRSTAERRAPLHLFAAAPNAFMFFLGRVSRGFGKCILYEYDFEQRDRRFRFPVEPHCQRRNKNGQQ